MSKKGDKMICTIWSGYQPGIYIGFPNRRKHFSKENNVVIIEIDGDKCTSSLSSSFWRGCPEIRVAKSRTGFNVLLNWIRKNSLLPPKASLKEKGKKDVVTLVVVEPYRRFRLSL